MGSIQQEFDAAHVLSKYGVDVGAILKEGQTVGAAITSLFPKQILKGAAEHEAWSKTLWSSHQRVAKPSLIFQPASAKEVAIAVLLCRHTQTKFAVKSGGHAAMKGASSIDKGIVLDLKNLDCVEFNEDKSIVRLGTGNRWERVFEIIGKEGLGVAGGRAGDVGVGGYTLGGGISFFASATGWGCDTVRNFELVTANGAILNVTHETYPDLFWALRGGGTNFGIVTAFDYETFPQADIFAGSVLYAHEEAGAAIKAFTAYAHDADPKAATWFTVAMFEGKKLISALAMYADPNPDAEFLKPYLAIPSLHSTVKVRSMADMVHEVAEVNVKDHRQDYTNHTFKFDADFVSWLANLYWEVMGPSLESYETKQGAALVLQIYTKESVAKMQRNGGNCLPLREEDAPYLNVLTPSAWLHEKDDELVFGLKSKIHALAVQEGKKRGLYVEFKYMNYASRTQDVLKGYGKANYDRLKLIATKYDPEGVFQTLMPGYFKFGGAPAH